MSKILDKPWKKLVVVVIVFLFVALAAQQSVTAQSGKGQAKQGSEKGDAAVLGGCAESVEEIKEAYTECQSEGCACGTWNPPS
jgi:hypothetical protein